MNEYLFSEIVAVSVITLLAVISPGADFAVVTSHSYLYGRKYGLYTSIGIACGVLFHVLYTLIAIHVLQGFSPNIISYLQYLGASYLIYLGYRTFKQPITHPQVDAPAPKPILALLNGFLTNALNPKTMLFVMSTFTQITQLSTPQIIFIAYGLFMSATHLLWFSLVSVVFSRPKLRNQMLQKQSLINQCLGSILILLGILLLASKL